MTRSTHTRASCPKTHARRRKIERQYRDAVINDGRLLQLWGSDIAEIFDVGKLCVTGFVQEIPCTVQRYVKRIDLRSALRDNLAHAKSSFNSYASRWKRPRALKSKFRTGGNPSEIEPLGHTPKEMEEILDGYDTWATNMGSTTFNLTALPSAQLIFTMASFIAPPGKVVSRNRISSFVQENLLRIVRSHMLGIQTLGPAGHMLLLGMGTLYLINLIAAAPKMSVQWKGGYQTVVSRLLITTDKDEEKERYDVIIERKINGLVRHYYKPEDLPKVGDLTAPLGVENFNDSTDNNRNILLNRQVLFRFIEIEDEQNSDLRNSTRTRLERRYTVMEPYVRKCCRWNVSFWIGQMARDAVLGAWRDSPERVMAQLHLKFSNIHNEAMNRGRLRRPDAKAFFDLFQNWRREGKFSVFALEGPGLMIPSWIARRHDMGCFPLYEILKNCETVVHEQWKQYLDEYSTHTNPSLTSHQARQNMEWFHAQFTVQSVVENVVRTDAFQSVASWWGATFN